MPLPLVLIHGYSDKGQSFEKWRDILVATEKYSHRNVQICSYVSLSNEVTLKDIAEGFDRALKENANIEKDQPFDAIVHSTGMLVLRSWLVVYGEQRTKRIKHIIGIAPATFGSPLAHKGRSWLGSIFKGNRKDGPDFMEAGDLVLDGLELGSKFTWELTHRDILNENIIFYGADEDTPYLFTFCGNTPYKGFKGLITNSPGTDGTVRWAGCTLNTRKITLDFTVSVNDPNKKRYYTQSWPSDKRFNLEMPFIPVKGLNHATILEDPSDELLEMVLRALEVNSRESYLEWVKYAKAKTKDTLDNMEGKYQQFVVHARDERGDAITDYNLQLYQAIDNPVPDENKWKPVKIDVHSYSGNNSYRCFHIDLGEVLDKDYKSLKLEFIASSGTALLGYMEYMENDMDVENLEVHPTFSMDLSNLLTDTQVNLFYPFTTTLIEVILNREPLPPKAKKNYVTWFLEDEKASVDK